MDIILHVDTKKLSSDFSDAIKEYTKRISPFGKMVTKTYKNISKISFVKGSNLHIILPGTDTIDSVALANDLNNAAINGYSTVEYVFVKNENLQILKDALSSLDHKYTIFNISSFDLSLEMATTVMAEQLYRAYTIQNNIKYHK